MVPILATAGISAVGSFLSSRSQKKAEREAQRRQQALMNEQRKLAEARETAAADSTVRSIESQVTSDLSNINFAQQAATGQAEASTAGLGVSGASISSLSTQVMIDAARDRANAIREAAQKTSQVKENLAVNQQNRAIEARYGATGSQISVGQNTLNAALMGLGQGLLKQFG